MPNKEYKIVVILNLLSSLLLGMALFLYFGGIQPKWVALSITAFAIILDFAKKFVAKTDAKAKIFAKTAGVFSIPILIILLLF